MNGHNTQGQQIERPGDWSWKFWLTLPIYPYGKRRSLLTEVMPNMVWTIDQVQGIFYVVVPIRMTVVKLEAGGLLVYAPVAPTPECIGLMNALVAAHGEVKYIILPTISGLEHKVFVGPFARCFPSAQVFVAPHQWSFPLNLPLSWLGFPPDRTHTLPPNPQDAPFASEFDYAILGPVHLGPGRFAEVAFFHRRSHTLLVTDTLVSVPAEPPAIVQLDPYPLLYHAKEDGSDRVEDTPETRRKGWQRVALFALFFRPSALTTVDLIPSIRAAFKAGDRSRKAYFGWFPFQWSDNWQQSFAALRGGGRLFVAPILQTLILNRAPQATLEWSDRVAEWDFNQVIPCHFDAPVAVTPSQFRQAFAFLEPPLKPVLAGDRPTPNSPALPPEDFILLKEIDTWLVRSKIVPPAPEK